MIFGLPDSIRGILWMMGSMASWACMAAVARYLSGDIHTFEIVFFRSIFGAIFLVPWLCKVGVSGIKTHRIGMHMVRGLVGLAVIYLLFAAIAQAPLGEIAAIMSTRPLVASLGAILILHEVAHGRRWTATIIGFVGALLIIRPGFSEVSVGVILALIAVIGMATLTIVMKSLARTEAPDTIVVWQMVVFTPCSLIPAIFVWQMPDTWQFLLLASTGLFGNLRVESSILTINNGSVSGSATSTGSFGRVEANGVVYADSFESVTGGTTIDFNDDVSLIGNLTASAHISASGNITGSDIYSSGRIYEAGSSVIDHATAMAIVFGG